MFNPRREKESVNVLSLFDGISCGYLALQRAGIHVDKYFASEVDNPAIKISKKNFPDIIHIGDIRDIDENIIKSLGFIDLVIGGSPCQTLTTVNSRINDKEYGIDGDGKSNLFWEYVRVLNLVKKHLNRDVYFLLENVEKTKKDEKEKISEILGSTYKIFDSMLVSAQYRKRAYWCNFEFDIPLKRKDIYMDDILENHVDDKYYISFKMKDYIMHKRIKGQGRGDGLNPKIARTLTASMHKMHRTDTDNYITTDYHPIDKTNIRKLTPVECERLQTLPDNYTEGVSDSQRYKMIGNGWTVDVLAHIFSYLPIKK